MSAHVQANGDSNEHRGFTLDDAVAVYNLSREASPLGAKVKDALETIDKAIVDYGLDQVALSFNGGKDCTVLVHLMAAFALRQLHSTWPPSASRPSGDSVNGDSTLEPYSSPRLKSVYVRCMSPFPQVETFVAVCAEKYRLDLQAVEGGMKEALQVYLNDHPTIKAILVGTRRNDPHGAELVPFQRTDPNWPDFMRVHPVLDWSYDEVWDFLRHPQLTLGGGPVQWCELYDYGYTSLGSTYNTFPNPLLRATDDASVLGGWRPAWELKDPLQERAGRGTKPTDVVEKSGISAGVWTGEAAAAAETA